MNKFKIFSGISLVTFCFNLSHMELAFDTISKPNHVYHETVNLIHQNRIYFSTSDYQWFLNI